MPTPTVSPLIIPDKTLRSIPVYPMNPKSPADLVTEAFPDVGYSNQDKQTFVRINDNEMNQEKTDFHRIANYTIKKLELNKAAIDDQTIRDLDLHGLYDHLCDTRTSLGRAVFYYWLINPAENAETYSSRLKKLNGYQANPETSKLLSGLGHQRTGDIVNELWAPHSMQTTSIHLLQHADAFLLVALAPLHCKSARDIFLEYRDSVRSVRTPIWSCP